MSPTIALVMGDPAGIGPELMARLLSDPDVLGEVAVVAIGDRRVFAEGARIAGVRLDPSVIGRDEPFEAVAGRVVLIDTANLDPEQITRGVASGAGGHSALENFSLALDLARAGHIDAITFVPFNKEALRLGGNPYGDELEFATAHIGHEGAVAEFNVVDAIWNARVTSHVPLREVADLITIERIHERLALAVSALKDAGLSRPRIAVAALNPHAGDGGAFGREDIDIIAPAVEQAQQWATDEDFEVAGPFPSDTVFLRAIKGEFDAVMTMFHDQGQIAIKLMGFDKGVTVLYGMPVPITTPAHGTAYDIAGRGLASFEPTRRAFMIAREMASRRSSATPRVAAARQAS
jgi:4-hydroxythreonine-4-phosphate dehydrogenase